LALNNHRIAESLEHGHGYKELEEIFCRRSGTEPLWSKGEMPHTSRIAIPREQSRSFVNPVDPLEIPIENPA